MPLEAPLPVIGEDDRYEVYMQWKDGPGGCHYKKTWADAVEFAATLVGAQWSEQYEIRIRHIVTKVWRYEPPTPPPERLRP